MLRPNTGSSNREGLIADGAQPCTTDSEKEDRRCLRAPKLAMHWNSSARYDGAVPGGHLYTRTANL